MLNISFQVGVLILSFLVYCGLALLVLAVNRRSDENRIFAAWVVMVGIWGLALAQYFSAETVQMAEYWMNAAYSAAVLAICTFFYFSLRFIRNYPFNRVILILDGITLLLFSIAIMVFDVMVADTIQGPHGFDIILRPVGWYVYAMFLLVHFLAAHLVLLMKHMKAKGSERLQLKYVLISVFIGGEVIGVLFNLILPSPVFNEWRYIWLGPSASAMVYAPVVAYAILKHKLFNVKGLLKELLVLIVVFLVLLDTLLARSWTEVAYRGLLSLVIVILAILMIRMLRAEDRQKRELQRLTKELVDANKKLEKRDQMRGEFISIASHQLRTPVSVMKGYLSLMLDGTYGRIPAKITDRLKQMYEMNERLVLLINNMLNMARIEKNRIDFGFKDVRIDEVAAGVVAEMAYKAEQKGLELKLKPFDDDMPKVISDEEKIREILINLIDNSIKYTQSGLIEISFGLDRRHRLVIVYIRDTGAGMTEEDATKVFEKFYRIHNPNVPKESGTGLGLFIVTRFLKGMGGKIWIEKTAPGAGTTFAFQIPFKPPEKKPGTDKSDSHET